MLRVTIIGFTALLLAACQPTAEAPASPDPIAPPPAEQAALDATWVALEEKYLGMETEPTDPLDRLEWREVHCNFMGGELGGDPEQDRAVNAWIDEHCVRQIEDARALRSVMATDTAAVSRIDAYLGRHGE